MNKHGELALHDEDEWLREGLEIVVGLASQPGIYQKMLKIHYAHHGGPLTDCSASICSVVVRRAVEVA